MPPRKKKSEAIVSPEMQAKLDRFRHEAQGVLELCSTAPLATQADVDRVDELLKLIHTTIKLLTEEQDRDIAAAQAEIDTKKSMYRTVFECLISGKDLLKSRLLGRNAAARAAVDAAVQTGAYASIAGAAVTSTAIREQEYWACEVVDEAQVPDAYWLLDLNSLNKQASREKDSFAVPGCRAVKRTKGVMK